MPSLINAAHESWSLPMLVTLVLVLTAVVYSRGWFRLRRAFPNAIPAWRLAAFMAGLFSVWIAIGSPLQALDDDLLTIHMVQHVLLMAVAPPLILLGAPALPFLHGFPQQFVRGTLGSFLRWPAVQRLGRILTHPVFAWLAARRPALAECHEVASLAHPPVPISSNLTVRCAFCFSRVL